METREEVDDLCHVAIAKRWKKLLVQMEQSVARKKQKSSVCITGGQEWKD